MKVVFITLAWVAIVLGWGQEGHQIVAQIAQNHLSPVAQKSILVYLNGKYTRLEQIAPLADDYDHTPEGAWSKPCHYCNLPRSATQFEMIWCGTCCVVGAIYNYTSILNTTQPSPCALDGTSTPCALEFLVHFVGDSHQPLHVGYEDDRGGNSVKVDWYSSQTNLHAVWDTKIIQQWISNFEDATQELEAMLKANPNLWDQYTANMDPLFWADESFDLVRNDVYHYTSTNLGDAYYNANLPIVKERLLAAGIRLAQTLNNALANF